MVARVRTVAFQGIETVDIDVQVHIASSLPRLTIVGLPDKAVAESRERVRAAITGCCGWPASSPIWRLAAT